MQTACDPQIGQPHLGQKPGVSGLLELRQAPRASPALPSPLFASSRTAAACPSVALRPPIQSAGRPHQKRARSSVLACAPNRAATAQSRGIQLFSVLRRQGFGRLQSARRRFAWGRTAKKAADTTAASFGLSFDRARSSISKTPHLFCRLSIYTLCSVVDAPTGGV